MLKILTQVKILYTLSVVIRVLFCGLTLLCISFLYCIMILQINFPLSQDFAQIWSGIYFKEQFDTSPLILVHTIWNILANLLFFANLSLNEKKHYIGYFLSILQWCLGLYEVVCTWLNLQEMFF